MEPPPSDPSQNGWLASLSLGESVWSLLSHAIIILFFLWFVVSWWNSRGSTTISKKFWREVWKFGISRLIFLFLCLIYPGVLLSYLYETWPIFSNPFVQNYIVEMSAALLIIGVSYYFRNDIKRFVEGLFGPIPVRVRLPLMTATAPIILGLERHIWRECNIDLTLDWRYAGRNALEGLVAGDIAIASDFAVVKFLNERRNENLAVLPFVVITDHLRVVVRARNSAATPWDIPDGPIAYYQHSVHEDFLRSLGRNILDSDPTATSVLDGLWKILPDCQGTASGFVLWEPHYAAFQDVTGFRVSDSGTDYIWLLCVVARYADLEREPRLAIQIYEALKRACGDCNDLDNVIGVCVRHFPEEFLGINEEILRRLLHQEPQHRFDIEVALTIMQRKLGRWNDSHQWGAGKLATLLEAKKIWPGVPLGVP